MTSPCRWSLVALVLLAVPLATRAAGTPDARCAAAVATAGLRFFERTSAGLARCVRAGGVGCRAGAAGGHGHDAAVASLARRVRRSCPAAVAATLAPGGACAGV